MGTAARVEGDYEMNKKKTVCPRCKIEAEEGSFAYKTGYCMYCGIPLVPVLTLQKDINQKQESEKTK
jgi:ribosomal protein L37E